MRALRPVAAFALALSLPLAALAQTSDSNSQLSALFAQLSQLEQQITSLSGASAPAPASSSASAPGSYSGVCPDLTENLSLGSSGSDVANLQAFLAGQGLFDASITGYFGTITQTAVGQWQESHGVVSGGDAASTGLGVVGPRTRAAIDAMCGAGTPEQPASCLPVQPPTAECSTGWQPVADAAGCTEYYQCSIPLPAASAASATTGAAATSSSPETCPVVVQPQCSGQVAPFETDSNGCVISYECVL